MSDLRHQFPCAADLARRGEYRHSITRRHPRARWWQHEKGVGCHCACFIFGNNWNQAAWREGAELVLIHLRDKWEILGCYASELQEDIALSRGSIAENPLAIFPGFPQKAPELVTMTQGPVFEIAIDTGAVQSGLAFPAKQF